VKAHYIVIVTEYGRTRSNWCSYRVFIPYHRSSNPRYVSYSPIEQTDKPHQGTDEQLQNST